MFVRELESYEPLAHEVARADTARINRLVGIEGHSTAGKSTLARRLASVCPAVVMSTDCYAGRDLSAPSYAGRLRLGRLADDLREALEWKALVLIEGICLRDVLEQMAIPAGLFVYCKRVTAAGLWADDPDNYVHDGRPDPGLSWVDTQSVDYHLRRRPLESADVVFVRREG